MATKSQLKQYFETGKIPTQAQFGNLIDSIFNIIGSPDGSLNINGDENNIKLSIKNYRSLHGIYMSQLSVSLHLFFNNDMLMAIPVYWMLGTLFIYRHLSYFLGTVILISHNHVKDVIVNMFYSMFVYLFVIMFLGIIDCLNIYTLSISLVISVFFETLQRWYYCKKYGII